MRYDGIKFILMDNGNNLHTPERLHSWKNKLGRPAVTVVLISLRHYLTHDKSD